MITFGLSAFYSFDSIYLYMYVYVDMFDLLLDIVDNFLTKPQISV